MDIHQWSMLAGVGMAVVSMLYYDVIGHWWHRWACVHDPKRSGWARYYECTTCGKRKVVDAGEYTRERSTPWIDGTWDKPWEPWELGPPPSPFPKLETRNQSAGGADAEERNAEVHHQTQKIMHDLREVHGPASNVFDHRRRQEMAMAMASTGTTADAAARAVEAYMTRTTHPTVWGPDVKTSAEVNEEFLKLMELIRDNPHDAIVHGDDVEIVRHTGDGYVIREVVSSRQQDQRGGHAARPSIVAGTRPPGLKSGSDESWR